MDDQILRYAMNLLGSAEVAEMEQRLKSDPKALAHLEVMRLSLRLLDKDRVPDSPPFNLAKNTLIKAYSTPTSIKLQSFRRHTHLATNHRNAIRRFDLIVAASILIIISGFLAPWLHQARAKAEKLACASNLREFHNSFQQFASLKPDGKYPFVEPSGANSFAGVYVPTLRQHGLLGDYHSVACPTNARKIPTETNLDQLASMYQNKSNLGYQRLVKEAGGDYAYNLGYNNQGKLEGLSNKSDSNSPILADKMHPANFDVSFNHGGSGHNILFVGGHIRWVPSRKIGNRGDDIFLNEDHKIRAGKHLQDHVLAPSHASPFGETGVID